LGGGDAHVFFIKPEEIAATAAFLLSDATKTITGTAIRIDSGRCC